MVKLLGVLIIIVGFALKLNNITTILLAALVTALTGGLGGLQKPGLYAAAGVLWRGFRADLPDLRQCGYVHGPGARYRPDSAAH